MNIAVLVCGQFREFEYAVRSWDSIKSLGCDFYFSTWSKSSQKNDLLNISIEEDINEEKIIKHLPNAVVSILNENDYEFSCETYGNVNSSINVKKNIFLWKNCMRLLKESDKQYERVILTRPDIFFTILNNDQPFKNLFSADFKFINNIYGLSEITVTEVRKQDDGRNNMYFVSDFLFISSFEIMENFIEKCPYFCTTAIHNELSYHILSLGYYVSLIPHVQVTIFRPNSRNRSINEYEWNTIHDDFVKWNTALLESGDIQKQHDIFVNKVSLSK